MGQTWFFPRQIPRWHNDQARCLGECLMMAGIHAKAEQIKQEHPRMADMMNRAAWHDRGSTLRAFAQMLETVKKYPGYWPELYRALTWR